MANIFLRWIGSFLFITSSVVLVACSTAPKSNAASNFASDTPECSRLEYLAQQENTTSYDIPAVSEYRSTAVFLQERLVARQLQNQLDRCVNSYAFSMVSTLHKTDEKVRSNTVQTVINNEVKEQINAIHQANARLKDCALIRKSFYEKSKGLPHNKYFTESQLASCNLDMKAIDKQSGNRFKLLFLGAIDSSLESFRKSWTDEIKHIASSVGSRTRLRETSRCKAHAEAVSNLIVSETDDGLHDVIDSPLLIGYRNCLK